MLMKKKSEKEIYLRIMLRVWRMLLGLQYLFHVSALNAYERNSASD